MTPQEKLAQQISLLESLATLDAEIKRLDTRVKDEKGGLEGLRRELDVLEGRLKVDRERVDEMQRTANELSTEARQSAAQYERSREKLSRSRNERESMAAERELDELRKLMRDRDDEVSKLNGLLDVARKSITDVQAQRDRVHGELTSSESGTSSRIVEAQTELDTRLAERGVVAKQVQAQTLRRYDAIRQKRGSGVARVVAGTCRACHISLPPQQVQRLMRCEALDECPNCHRILYWQPERAAGDEAAK